MVKESFLSWRCYSQILLIVAEWGWVERAAGSQEWTDAEFALFPVMRKQADVPVCVVKQPYWLLPASFVRRSGY